MERMTLHEAQTHVARNAGRAGIDPERLDWTSPVETALTCFVAAGQTTDPERGQAAHRIGRILLAYHAHLAFEAGRQFADEAADRHLRRDAFLVRSKPEIAEALIAAAGEIRDGLHYAEEAHQ